MSKRIKILLFFVIGLAIIVFLLKGNFYKNQIKPILPSEEVAPDLSNLDLLSSPLESLKIPELDLNFNFDNSSIESIGNIIPNLTPETSLFDTDSLLQNVDFTDLQGLDFNPALSPQQNNTSNLEPNEEICKQFAAAPSCSFVPEQYRDLCNKCKAKGY